MKSDNLDDIFKKKRTSDLSFILRIAAIGFAMLIMFYLFFFLFNISDDNSYQIEQNGEKYGKKEINITILIFMVLVNQYINLFMKLLIKKFLIVYWIFQN